jgi:hypothetical protein
MGGQIILWEGNTPASIPASATSPEKILPFANSRQLSKRDCSQVINAFKNQSYEMVSTFIWSKAISSLKAQLSKLGTGFIAEMLDRADIDEGASITEVLTDYDALRLAYELGVITSTGYLRLKHAFEKIAHFGQLPPEEADEVQMSEDEAVGVIRACVENILGQNKIDAAVDFKKFRDHLESAVFEQDASDIKLLVNSPYFFKRASTRIVLAMIKSSTGAQLDNALGNANVIMPLLWPELLAPERFQVGRAYSEVVADGKAQAASGLKIILLKVKGFDYVPEDLRSRSFSSIARKVLEAHEGFNNFHNEPGPMKALAEMGSVIPRPAFPLCMTASLCVRLGNVYGVSFAARPHANSVLKRVSKERWLFYLDSCLRADDRILEKLISDTIYARWVSLVQEFELGSVAEDVKDRHVRELIQESKDASKPVRVRQIVTRMLMKNGYKVSY